MTISRLRRKLTPIRRNQPSERYGQITVEVFQSPACCAMPDYAFRVLMLAAAQYSGFNNGDLSVTSKSAREVGLTGWKLSVGLWLLQECGLLEMTRQGHICRGKGVPSLYALGWREIDPSEKYDKPIATRHPAPNRWARWEPPQDWAQRERQRRITAQGNRNRRRWNDVKSHPTRVDNFAPPACIEHPNNDPIRPTRVDRKFNRVVTPELSPSENLGGGVSSEAPPTSQDPPCVH